MDAQRQSSGYLKYMWLIAGCVLTVFIGMRWNVPTAAWLAPVFPIRFCRSQCAGSSPAIQHIDLFEST